MNSRLVGTWLLELGNDPNRPNRESGTGRGLDGFMDAGTQRTRAGQGFEVGGTKCARTGNVHARGHGVCTASVASRRTWLAEQGNSGGSGGGCNPANLRRPDDVQA